MFRISAWGGRNSCNGDLLVIGVAVVRRRATGESQSRECKGHDTGEKGNRCLLRGEGVRHFGSFRSMRAVTNCPKAMGFILGIYDGLATWLVIVKFECWL